MKDLFRPWTEARTWWSIVHLLLGGLIGIITFTVAFTLVAIALPLLITLLFAIPVAWALFAFARASATVERSRYRALLGVELGDPVPPLKGSNPWKRFLERFGVRARWLEIVYDFVRFPLGLVTAALVVITWCGSIAMIGLPFYYDDLPGGTAKFGLFEVSSAGSALGLMLLGIIGLIIVAPWSTLGLARVDQIVARLLIGQPESFELEAQVHQLEHSRVAAVDSAEAERRRIERDLHDGAQQRMVAVAMSLGAARARLDTDPEGGRQLVADAHEEAKAAIRDLRDLVRGIHPAILSDRGLDAALSSVVARSPIPVTLSVKISERPSAAVESAAYFFVMEALANVATHSHATRASVTIERAGPRLVVEVSDNGEGGADPANGSGLHGLEDRVASLGGWMHVVSPIGGPTTLLAEIPCAS